MKHSIKINGEIKEINCQFGTGYFDKNNQEIFEGNKVRNFSCFDDASINIKNRMSNPYLRENFQVYDRENDLWKGNWKSFKSCYTKIYKNL